VPGVGFSTQPGIGSDSILPLTIRMTRSQPFNAPACKHQDKLTQHDSFLVAITAASTLSASGKRLAQPGMSAFGTKPTVRILDRNYAFNDKADLTERRALMIELLTALTMRKKDRWFLSDMSRRVQRIGQGICKGSISRASAFS
jgi:hypothetical protein